jgi:hypothetical protein
MDVEHIGSMDFGSASKELIVSGVWKMTKCGRVGVKLLEFC